MLHYTCANLASYDNQSLLNTPHKYKDNDQNTFPYQNSFNSRKGCALHPLQGTLYPQWYIYFFMNRILLTKSKELRHADSK